MRKLPGAISADFTREVTVHHNRNVAHRARRTNVAILAVVSLACALALIGAAVHPRSNPNLTYTQERKDTEVSSLRAAVRTTGASVTPYMADEFADSFAVNTRFGQGIYAGQRPTVERYLVELGFRHIRDGGIIYNAETRAYLRGLCTRYGIHPSLGLNDSDPDAAIVQYVKDVPCIDMVEGPNELNGQPNWMQRLATFMPHAYELVKHTPAFAGIPVVGPSITSVDDAEQLGKLIDLSKYVDYGNKHSYPGQRNIGGRDGTGDHGFGSKHPGCPQYAYGSFFFNICQVQLFTDDRPIWTTETGFSSTPEGAPSPNVHPPYGSIPYDVAVKYFTRTMAYEFLNGITRTYIMALLDGASGCNGSFNTLGLIEQDCPNTGLASSLHPKPPFYALKNLMAVVADPGPPFTPAPISLKISGAGNALQWLLLQKRSGEYVLLYWVEGSDWNVDAGTPERVAPEQIIVSVGEMGDTSAAQTFGIENDGNLSRPVPVRFSGNNVKVTATDAMQFLTFRMPNHG
jgi:hypothetical protein